MDSLLNTRVNFKVDKLTLSATLDSLLFRFPISFYINDNHITLIYDPTIKKRVQDHKVWITGKIHNHLNETLHGASVYLQNHKKGFTTNENGIFKLAVQSLPVKIKVSYVGYEAEEFMIIDTSLQLLSLKEVVEELDLMINTGYIRQAKDRFTGKLASLTANEISQNNNPDILQNVATQIPGMIQHFNFDPTNNIPQYQIRGRTTIHANPNPLIILDQIPYQSNTMNIHPEDIARVDVLKDAAATAIWGARSGNGVIVFTTKEGKLNNKAKVTASLTTGVSSRKDLFADDFLSSSEVIDLELRLFEQNYFDRYYNTLRHPVLSPVVELKFAERMGHKDAAEVNSKIEEYRYKDIRNDIKNHLQRNANYIQSNIQMMGGGKQNSYFFSVGNLRQEHELPHKFSNRLTINSKNRFLPIEGVEIGNHILYTDWKHELPHDPTKNLNKMVQYAPWVDELGKPTSIPFENRQSLKDSMVSSLGYRDWNYYPLLEHRDNHEVKYRTELLFQLNAKFKIKKKLHLDLIYNFNFGYFQDIHRAKENSFFNRNLYNTFAWVENNEIKSTIPSGEIRNEGITNDKTQTYRITATYHFEVPKWHLKSMVVVGGEARKRAIDFTNELKFGYNSSDKSHVYLDMEPLYPTFNKTSLNLLGIQNRDNFNVNENYYSEFFLLTNHWKNLMTIETNIRRDASNMFGENINNKFIPLWSLGSKFKLHKIFKTEKLKDLELNINYGKTGNIDHNATSYLQVISRSSSTLTDFLQIYKPSDPNLKWESSGNLNIGFTKHIRPLGLTINADYYQNHSKDLIINKKTDPILGVYNAWLNDGYLISRGVEVNLALESKLNNKINLYNQLSFNLNKSVIRDYQATDLRKSELLSGPILNIKNEEIYNVYSTHWKGIDQNNGVSILPNDNYNSIEEYLLEQGLDNTKYMGNLNSKYYLKWYSQLKIGKRFNISLNLTYLSNFIIKIQSSQTNLIYSPFINFQQKYIREITDYSSSNDLLKNLKYSNEFYLSHSDKSYYNTSILNFDYLNFNYSFGKLNHFIVNLGFNNLIQLSNKSSKKIIYNNFERTVHVNLKYNL